VTERADEGVARIVELNQRVGADFSAGVRRNAGVNDAGDQFQPQGGYVSYVAFRTASQLNGEQLFFSTFICTVDLLRCAATCLT